MTRARAFHEEAKEKESQKVEKEKARAKVVVDSRRHHGHEGQPAV